MLISKGVSKLRTVGAKSDDANQPIDLYRGMRNRELPEEFFPRGDTRLDLMSTTPCLDVALRYAASRPSLRSVIFRLRMQGSPERGADLTFLSGFPDERESLFPPLSYLERHEPTGRRRRISATRLSPSSRWSQTKAEQCKSMMACGRP